MIGAEGFEPLAGWPYAEVLEAVNCAAQNPTSNPDDDVRELSKDIVCKYIGYYADYQVGGVSVDLAACDLSQSKQLAVAIKGLSQVLRNQLGENKPGNAELRNALILAHWEAQPYKREQYTDLYDFCERLQTYYSNAEVKKICQNVKCAIRGYAREKNKENFIEPDDAFPAFLYNGQEKLWNFRDMSGFVLKSCYSGPTVQYSSGVAIYFP